MANQHPIHPPIELVQELWDRLRKAPDSGVDAATAWTEAVALAAQWGADQELGACCEWLKQDWEDVWTSTKLRAARRPKPPSLKELALAELDLIPTHDSEGRSVGADVSILRRALEALPND